MKMRVIEWLKENPCSNIDDIMVALKGEYGKEGQFSKLNFNHMINPCGGYKFRFNNASRQMND